MSAEDSTATARRVVITGIGMVHPSGVGHEQVWSTVRAGTNVLSTIDKFDTTDSEVRVAGQLPEDFTVRDYLPARYAKRTDPFTQYAMVATDLALHDAKLTPAEENPFRVGTSFGNSGGGWGLYERGLDEYFHDGPTMVNPYLATSWFNYAAQGYSTIRHGIRGDSATYISGRASGALATYFGIRSVQWGINDVVLAGGCEAPLTPLGIACHASTGELSRRGQYRAFGQEPDGLVLGEGSTILVLEEESRARQRGAHIYGELRGISHSRAPVDSSRGLVRTMNRAVEAAGLKRGDIGGVFAEGAASRHCDRVESTAIRDVFGNTAPPVTVPRAGYGHQHGASFATEVALSVLASGAGELPPTPGAAEPDPELGITRVDARTPMSSRAVLTNSYARNGMCTSAVVEGAR